jgi:hypothetical protein
MTAIFAGIRVSAVLEPLFNVGSTIPDRSSDLDEAGSDPPYAPLRQGIRVKTERSRSRLCREQFRNDGMATRRRCAAQAVAGHSIILGRKIPG